MEVSKNISNKYIFSFPNEIKLVNYKDKILIVSPNTANWLVANNNDQVKFFKILQSGLTLENSLKEFNGNIEDAQWILVQIFAKKFEDCHIVRFNSRSLHLYLTNACNLHCPFCYMDAGKKNDDELSYIEVTTLFSEFKKRGGAVVTISGGEATLRTDFCDIVRYAHNIGLKVNVFSNGVLWTASMINNIASCIDKIQISIDGFNEEENAKIRGKGSFDKALKTVELFVQKHVPVEIACTPNFDEDLASKVDKYVEFGQHLMNKYQEHSFVIKFNGEILDGRERKFSEQEKESFIKSIEKINSLCHGISSRDDGIVQMLLRKEVKDNCAFGNLNVSSNGDVYFCSLIPTLKKVANIRQDSYDYIFKLSEDAKLKSNVDNLFPCCNCELKYICGGDCRIHHFESMKEGNITLNQAFRKCDVLQKNIFYDMLIRINERLFQ